ncbi:MAG: MoaD/ThiS family protein [Verrucomicrobia bacterium]|jgi:molybdopterin converting factor small subunit|nr:MoaD/ThiS family protein [Verrucomicrobiota bacterium]
MKVLYFAQAATAAGTSAEDWGNFPGGSASDVWNEAISRHPALAGLKNSSRLARNAAHTAENETFEPGDEVAILPPVSGG